MQQLFTELSWSFHVQSKARRPLDPGPHRTLRANTDALELRHVKILGEGSRRAWGTHCPALGVRRPRRAHMLALARLHPRPASVGQHRRRRRRMALPGKKERHALFFLPRGSLASLACFPSSMNRGRARTHTGTTKARAENRRTAGDGRGRSRVIIGGGLVARRALLR